MDLPDVVRRFLDTEAEVRNGSDSEGDEEDPLDGFIDDDDLPPTEGSSETSPTVSWNTLAQQNQALDDLLDGIYSRSQAHTRRLPVQDASEHSHEISGHSLIRALPHSQDFPLWRIGCRVGLEEEAVFFLSQMVSDEHQIRSAFTRGSLRGWIYVEGIVDSNLISLLKKAPGIISRQQCLICHSIDPSDWTKLLTMHDPGTIVGVGQWIQVCKSGAYKGDCGLVASVDSWGAEVLLVPRLKAPNTDSSLKRKRTTVYREPELFDPATFKHLYGIDPRLQDTGSYKSRGYIFEYGLLRRRFDFHSLSSAVVGIPSHFFLLFQLSQHPTIIASDFPRPNEWIFEEGEQVLIRSSNKKATVTAIRTNCLEVNLGPEGNAAVPWRNIRKGFAIGNYVSVTSGPFQGTAGWIDRIDGDLASLLEQPLKGGSGSNSSREMKNFEFHVNWLKLTDVPFLHAPAPLEPTDNLFRADKVPWLGTTVIVTKQGHPCKGYLGTVKNVLRGQDTPTGLKIELKLDHYNPSCPYGVLVIDHDDVVEINSGFRLLDFVKPTSQLFQPSRGYKQPQASTSGAATPMPTSWTSSTPAWDPSSRTPGPVDSLSFTTAENASDPPSLPVASSSRTPVTQQHPLFDERLIGVVLRANVNGDKYKNSELPVSIAEAEGCFSILHMLPTKSKPLASSWVSPKHPNPTRDNGLLVVIKGEHCGKLVRRIHHRYDDSHQAFVKLAVVKKEPGAADTILGEQLELTVDFLCLGSETPDEKTRNASLMESLRAEARAQARKK